MNGYLMQDIELRRGEDTFVESFASENRYGVIFEDDGDTAYFYAVEKDAEGQGLKVLDALHIYERSEEDGESEEGEFEDGASEDSEPEKGNPEDGESRTSRLMIIWSRDWLKAALVIDKYCHAIFDFESQGGYNINEFPPPNEFWTKGTRALTDELVQKFF